MTQEAKRGEFELGDSVINIESNEKGTVARLSADESVIHVRWGESKIQTMIETKKLKRHPGGTGTK